MVETLLILGALAGGSFLVSKLGKGSSNKTPEKPRYNQWGQRLPSNYSGMCQEW